MSQHRPKRSVDESTNGDDHDNRVKRVKQCEHRVVSIMLLCAEIDGLVAAQGDEKQSRPYDVILLDIEVGISGVFHGNLFVMVCFHLSGNCFSPELRP